MKDFWKILLIIALVILAKAIMITGLIFILVLGADYDVTRDKSKYNDAIGEKAKDKYEIKWGMSEEIFPSSIKDLDVKDFKMVYYDPWDKQYLAYLVVDYDEDTYKKEVNRLEKIGIDKYIGYYGVTGFSKYKLLAMEADPYYGFVYAITKNNQIIYVELIFCNYFMDINYKKHINNDYLPDGFDATTDNPYEESMMKQGK